MGARRDSQTAPTVPMISDDFIVSNKIKARKIKSKESLNADQKRIWYFYLTVAIRKMPYIHKDIKTILLQPIGKQAKKLPKKCSLT